MVWMDNRPENIREDITSYPNYRDWRDQSGVVRAARRLYQQSAFTLTGADEPERLSGAQVTANFFDVMGVQPLLGRVFTEAQETPGRDAVVPSSLTACGSGGSAAHRTCSAGPSS